MNAEVAEDQVSISTTFSYHAFQEVRRPDIEGPFLAKTSLPVITFWWTYYNSIVSVWKPFLRPSQSESFIWSRDRGGRGLFSNLKPDESESKVCNGNQRKLDYLWLCQRLKILQPSQSDCVITVISVLNLSNQRAPFGHVGGAYFQI